jgi:hypothetical protein
MLWSGTAASFIDLHPTSGFTGSSAFGTDGTRQVGVGVTGGVDHALLWSGSAASVVDLHSVLPTMMFSSSQAHAIDGNSVYGYAQDTSGTYHAIAWTVPEPGSVPVLSLAACAAALHPRRQRCAR